MIVCLTGIKVNAQEKELMSDASIKTQVIWITEKKGIKEYKYKSQELRFDRKGNRVEEIYYSRRGKIIHHLAFDYEKGLKIREIKLDPKGFIITRTDYRYVNKVPVELTVYNGKGEIVRTEMFIYEYQD